MIQEISAPGKLVLAGEYAVLEGYAGLAMAVDRRVTLRPSSKYLNHSNLWNAVSEGQQKPFFEISSRALYEGTHKLGLGSSAASAVCMAAYLSSENVYSTALAGHRRFSGGLGSGIDVAASYHGGLIRFQNTKISVLQANLNPQILLCVFTHKSQNTRFFLNHVLDYKTREPEDFKQRMKDIGDLTPIWESLYTQNWDWYVLSKLVQENIYLLEKLSQKAHIYLLSPEQQKIQTICAQYGAYSKPSGAGGGDITLCFVPPETRENLIKFLNQAGFLPLNLHYFSPGLKILSV